MTGEQWGPWINHHGNGRPNLDGVVREIEYADGSICVSAGKSKRFVPCAKSKYSGPLYWSSWDWSRTGDEIPVLRYRIREPRGMTVLQAIAAQPDRVIEPTRVDV